jgi:AcrR family transcriptional regulator
MTPKADVSEQRKNQIIEAAILVFTRLGFHKARMDDIVAETGLSKGALYWYFKSKEELIISILDRVFGAELEQMEAFSDPALPARQCLLNFMDFFITDLRSMQRLMPIISEFYALAFRNQTVRAVMQRFLNTFVARVEPIIQRGIDQGEFRSAEARQVAIAFGAQLDGTLLLWSYAPEMMDLETQLRAGADMMLRALDSPPAAAEG